MQEWKEGLMGSGLVLTCLTLLPFIIGSANLESEIER